MGLPHSLAVRGIQCIQLIHRVDSRLVQFSVGFMVHPYAHPFGPLHDRSRVCPTASSLSFATATVYHQATSHRRQLCKYGATASKLLTKSRQTILNGDEVWIYIRATHPLSLCAAHLPLDRGPSCSFTFFHPWHAYNPSTTALSTSRPASSHTTRHTPR